MLNLSQLKAVIVICPVVLAETKPSLQASLSPVYLCWVSVKAFSLCVPPTHSPGWCYWGPLVTTPAPPRISRASSFPWLMHVLCSLLFVLYPSEHVLCMCVHTHMATRHKRVLLCGFPPLSKSLNWFFGFSVGPLKGRQAEDLASLWVWSQRSKLCEMHPYKLVNVFRVK